MAAPTLSTVVLTGALIIVIFTVQFFYFRVVDNVWAEMVRRELKEIADYVADTIANLYFLANSTSTSSLLEKTLRLPVEIEGSFFTLEIIRSQSNYAQSVKAISLKGSWLNANSWLPPGLLVNVGKTQTIQSSGTAAVAGCQRVSSNIYVWIAYKG
jgi:hypothetical protein